MSDFLIRNVEPKTMAKLKARAKRHGRSLQSEVKTVLREAAGADSVEVAAIFGKWDRRFAGRPPVGDSVELIREDRER